MREVVSVFAIVLNGVALLPALFLATYDHQGVSPIEGWQVLQLAVVTAGLALAIWGYVNDRIGATLASFVVVAGWVLLGFALPE